MNRRWLWMVLALTLLTGALRSIGRDYLLPYGPEPDGLVYEKQVRTLEEGRHEARGQHLYGFYPLLPAALTAVLTEAPHADDVPRPVDEQLERAASQRARIRLVIAWLSALAVPFVWLLARRFVPDAWAFAAAALCAVDPFVLWFAQQARPHAALLPWVAAALWAATHLARRCGWRECVWAAFAAAGAVCTLQSGIAVLVPMFVAVCFSLRSGAALVRVLVGLGLVALAAWLAYPTATGVSSAVGVGSNTLELSGHKMDLTIFNGAGFAKVWAALRDYDPLLLGAVLLGSVLWLVHRTRRVSREALVVASFVVAYVVAIGLYQRTYQRFVLQLVPALCVLVVWSVWILQRRWSYGAKALLVLVLLGQMNLTAGILRARTAADTFVEAATWIEAHVPTNEPVAFMPPLDLPLWMDDRSVARNEPFLLDEAYPWYTWRWRSRALGDSGRPLWVMPLATPAQREAAKQDPVAYVSTLGARWLVIEDHRGRRPLLALLRATIASRADLMVRVSPHDDPDEALPLVHQDDDFQRSLPWTWSVARAGQVGPVIEVWRLRE